MQKSNPTHNQEKRQARRSMRHDTSPQRFVTSKRLDVGVEQNRYLHVEWFAGIETGPSPVHTRPSDLVTLEWGKYFSTAGEASTKF